MDGAEQLRAMLFDPEPPSIGLPAQRVEALRALMAQRVRTSRSPGTLRLEEAFAESLRGVDLEPLFGDFATSPHYAAVREVQDGTDGDPVEVAFARFLRDRGVALAPLELPRAMMRLLTLCDPPAFEVPAWVRRCPGGHWVVVDGVLLAASRQRFIEGAVPPGVVALLERGRGAPGSPVARRLAGLGLISLD